MNYLQQLLKDQKVEWKKLGEVCDVLRGRRLTKKQLSQDKEGFAVFHGGIVPIGYYPTANRKANSTMVINVGASAGTVGFSREDFWSSDGCFCFTENSILLQRFLFYYLQSIEHEIKSKVRVAGIPTLDAGILSNLEIPLPPLSVQSRIVEILDKFTALEAELEQQLQAELELRKKQYQHYREQLLNFSSTPPHRFNVIWRKLGEVCTRTSGTKITAGKMKDLHKENAPIKIFAGGKTIAFVDYGDIPQKDIYTTPSVIVKSRGIIEVEYYDKPFSHKSEMWSYASKSSELDTKFLYYYLKTLEFDLQRVASKMQMPQIAISDTESLPIPLPPLSVQSRIVEILDKFDALTNSITEGLPLEIKLRRQQYEYYREQLLDFRGS
jgi:hypothetical protein